LGSLGSADDVASVANGVVNNLSEIKKLNLVFNLVVDGQAMHNVQSSLGDHIIVLQGIGLPTDKHVAAGKAAEDACSHLDAANELMKEALGKIDQARDLIKTIPGLLSRGSSGYLLNEKPQENKPEKPARHLHSIQPPSNTNKKEDDA
jgi:hypothetical protein